MSTSFNNFCEALVNNSNPRYIGSQPTINQQVAYQVQQQQQSFNQACFAARQDEIQNKVNNNYHVSRFDINLYKK